VSFDFSIAKHIGESFFSCTVWYGIV